MPFSVRDAIRSGEETGADLASGAAWSALLESLQRAAAVVLSDRVPQNPVDTAAGFRHLLVLLHIAIEEIVRSGGTLGHQAGEHRQRDQVGDGLSRLCVLRLRDPR